MKPVVCVLLLTFSSCSHQGDAEKSPSPATAKQPGGLSWVAPAGWIVENPSSQMRSAQYRLPRAEGDPEDATCIVFHFPGGGGGVEANIERWYGQFIQPDGGSSAEAASIQSTMVSGLKQTEVDLTGTYLFSPNPMASTKTEKPNFRMLATIVETSSAPWFVKLVGPETTVEKWRPSFKSFTQSFKE